MTLTISMVAEAVEAGVAEALASHAAKHPSKAPARPRVVLKKLLTGDDGEHFMVTGTVNTMRWPIGGIYPPEALEAWIDAGEVDVEINDCPPI